MLIPVLHIVTNDLVIARPLFLERARAVMQSAGTLGALHLRARSLSAARLYELAISLRSAHASTGCWIVINDRLDIALTAGAQGAQLTSRSMGVADARGLVGSLPLGASVHSVGEAVDAAATGADWVVAGHVYPTPSHGGVREQGLELVREVANSVRVPCIAIGGVRPEHVPALLAAGAHGAAAISGIWGATDAGLAAADYLSHYERDHGL